MKPILFNKEMVRAILGGSCTRRLKNTYGRDKFYKKSTS